MNNLFIFEERAADISDYSDATASLVPKSSDISDDCTPAVLNQYTLRNFKTNSSVFLRMLREEHFEPGYSNGIDELVNSLIEKDPIIAAAWLNDIYVNHYSDKRVLYAVLFTISRIGNEAIRYSTFMTMAIAGLSHKDLEIRETAIRCFENWGDIRSLNCLKASNKDSVDWINDYKTQVIADIEKSLS